MEIIAELKTYEWGKLGPASKVAQLARLNDEKFEIEFEKPYAEMWMGTHINGSAKVKKTGESLATIIKNDPSLVGGLESLPFLIKVISVNKALSLQMHPNKDESMLLHEQFPDQFRDGNHKPEMTIALTPLLAMCGFRTREAIHKNLKETPELIELLGTECIDGVESNMATGVKECFSKLMNSNQVRVSMCVKTIGERFELELRTDDIATTFHQLQHDFPSDIGCLCLFFVNIIKLKPGQALYLGSNIIHAYLDGDCIECSGCSDNTIRAGLTPKPKNVKLLLKMVDYTGAPGTSYLVIPAPHPTLKFTKLFCPPIKDYTLVEIMVPATNPNYKIENRTFGSIFIVLTGTGTINVHNNEIDLVPGSIIFLAAVADGQLSEEFSLVVKSKDNFYAYQVMHNDFPDIYGDETTK